MKSTNSARTPPGMAAGQRPARGRGLLLASLLFALSPLACQAEEENLVVVRLSAAQVTAAEELDTLVLTITASDTAAGDRVCEPYQVAYSLDPADATAIELPYSLGVRPGARYDRVLYLRVEGFRGGTLRYRTERSGSLAGGKVTLDIAIASDCLGRGLDPGHHCLGGLDSLSPYAAIFDEGQFVQPGETCRAEP